MRRGQAALDWCAAEDAHASQNWYNWCLVFSRKAFDVAAKYPDAKSGWAHTQHRHGTVGVAPPAVPIWWTGGAHGHVAVSAGNGYCYSTDILAHGKVDRVPIALIAHKWHLTYKGWTEDINDVKVYTQGPAVNLPAVDLSDVRAALQSVSPFPSNSGAATSDMGRLEAALRAEGLLPAVKPAAGYPGSVWRQAYGAWQQRSGVGQPFDGIPGNQSLTLLGNRYGFRVVP